MDTSVDNYSIIFTAHHVTLTDCCLALAASASPCLPGWQLSWQCGQLHRLLNFHLCQLHTSPEQAAPICLHKWDCNGMLHCVAVWHMPCMVKQDDGTLQPSTEVPSAKWCAEVAAGMDFTSSQHHSALHGVPTTSNTHDHS